MVKQEKQNKAGLLAAVVAAAFVVGGVSVGADAQSSKEPHKESKNNNGAQSTQPSLRPPANRQDQRDVKMPTKSGDLSDGRIEFEEPALDFGKRAFGEELHGEFRFKNTGTETLVIERTRSSCGCTVPELDKKEYGPGESGVIKVKYSPKGTGKQTKTITVVTNSREQERVVLSVTATAVDVVKTTPKLAQFGEVLRGEEKTLDIAVDSIDPDFKLIEAYVDDTTRGAEYVKAEILPDDYEWKLPETDRMPYRKGIRLTISEDAPIGRLLRKIVIKTEAKMEGESVAKEREITINAHAAVVGDLRAAPPTIRIRTVNSGEDFEGKTVIASRSGKKFEIEDISVEKSTIPGVKATWEPWSDGEGTSGYEVTVSGSTVDQKGVYRGHLKVNTNIAGEQPLLITFSGAVRSQTARMPMSKGNAKTDR